MRAVHGGSLDLSKRAREPIRWWRFRQAAPRSDRTLPDYSERWFKGERISTAFVESTVNLVVSRRFAKKQQMQWSKQGAHRLLQTRTKTLDGTLRDLFSTWYPALAANDNQVPALAIAA